MSTIPINMPDAAADGYPAGYIFEAGNGVKYQWDGDKWVSYLEPDQQQNWWDRIVVSDGTSWLRQLERGDDVGLVNTNNVIKIYMDVSDSSIECRKIVTERCNTDQLKVLNETTGAQVALIDTAGELTCENISIDTFPTLPA